MNSATLNYIANSLHTRYRTFLFIYAVLYFSCITRFFFMIQGLAILCNLRFIIFYCFNDVHEIPILFDVVSLVFIILFHY